MYGQRLWRAAEDFGQAHGPEQCLYLINSIGLNTSGANFTMNVSFHQDDVPRRNSLSTATFD